MLILTKEIPLTQGKITLVDDDDYERLKDIKFHAKRDQKNWYAKYSINGNTKGWLHRLVLDLKDDERIDHINGDGLDNRKCNLRVSNHSQNASNKRKQDEGNSSSRYKGVMFHKQTGKWQSAIRKDGKRYHLGLFNTEEEAGLAYDNKSLELFGVFARTNLKELTLKIQSAEKNLEIVNKKHGEDSELIEHQGELLRGFEAEVNNITKLYEESKTARHNLSREFFNKEKVFQQKLAQFEKDDKQCMGVIKELRIIRGLAEARYIDAEGSLKYAKNAINELIKYAEMGIAENDDALIESPVSMYRYTLKQLLIAKKALEGETCQNIEHRHPCYRNEYCPNCGISTCSPNYAYHVCVAPRSEKALGDEK